MLDSWHYPRVELARSTLVALTQGPAQAVTLSAPRRSGKTAFLLNDLAPHAEGQGHRLIHASFWEGSAAPLAVLLHDLEGARRQPTLADRQGRILTGIRPRIGPVAPLAPPTGIEASRAASPPPEDLLKLLDDGLGELARGRKPAILLLDGVEALARDPAHAGLLAALRRGIESRPQGLRVIFTLSGPAGHRALFGTRRAPFHRFATALELPLLGEPFVDHGIQTVRQVSNRRLDRGPLLAAFRTLHGSPFLFRALLESLVLNPTLPVAEALIRLRREAARRLGYPQLWTDLSPLQRAALRLLADGEASPFSVGSRTRLGALLEEPAPTAARVQAALRKLERLGLATSLDRSWVLEDPALGDWVRDVAAP